MQRQTRTSLTRFDQDLDHVRPTKKLKIGDADARPTVKQTNTSRESGRDLDTNGDAFTFKRKTKKPPTNHQPVPQPVSQGPPTSENASLDPDAKPRGRKRTSQSRDEPATQASSERPARRSKRLSGENARPPEENATLHVERKRRETKIALPFADTPVIQRNKDMRQASAENRRRSSSTFRGRRASSLMDSGTGNAIPHATIATAQFYKHISNDLPEPRRMKQLLTWCSSRALTERPPATSQGSDITLIFAARAIQDELVRAFTESSQMSDWFSRDEEIRPTALIKKPNPRNLQNAAKLGELEAEVQRLEQEKSQWDGLLSGLSSRLDTAITATAQDALAPNPTKVGLDSASSTTADARMRLQKAVSALEFKLDVFSEGVHKLGVLDEIARERADDVMAGLSTALDERRDAAIARTGGAKGTVGDVLRALSQERKHPS